MSSTTDTITVPAPKPLRRCAIIGTAPSWKLCPWEDKTLEVFGLNDAYVLGLPRASAWFDLHPWHSMVFHKGPISAENVPAGAYLRPAGHLEWLANQAMPVFVQHDVANHPSLRRFPIEQIQQAFGDLAPLRRQLDGTITKGQFYTASTPVLMLMWAILEGYTEIHIYGIHLATEWEYIAQRPNLEYFLGWAMAKGITIVLPEQTPICRASHVYAYQPKTDRAKEGLKRRMDVLKAEGKQLQKKMATKAGQKLWGARLQQLELELADLHGQITRLQMLGLVH